MPGGGRVVIDDIDPEVARLVEEEGRALGVYAMAVMADVTKPDEVKQLVKATLDQFDRIDNQYQPGPFHEMNQTDLKYYTVNK